MKRTWMLAGFIWLVAGCGSKPPRAGLADECA